MPWDSGLDQDSVAYRIAASVSTKLRVIAGPGTGKSFAMKRRVARLLEQGVRAQQVLPVTFTRVAAEDLHRELVGLNVAGSDQLRGRTLHSLGLRVLNRNQVLQATGRVPRPLNQFELEPLIRDLPGRFGGVRQKKKRRLAYEAAWARLQREQPGHAELPEDRDFEEELLRWLRFHRAMLIGEVIPLLYVYLRNNPAAEERMEFRHVLVDEFQDLNRAEQQVIELLGAAGSLCIVGDDDQSIYSFKHAHPEGIREWAAQDPARVDETLIECRRCPTGVVALANSLIRQNRTRVQRELLPRQENGAGVVEILQFQTLDEEASGIADRIQMMIRAGTATAGDIIVLAQRRVIGTPIFQALRERQMPVKSYFEETQLDSIEAQRQLSLLKLIVNQDDRVALRWLLGHGHPQFHANSYARIREYCNLHMAPPWNVLADLADGRIAIPYTGTLAQRFIELRHAINELQNVAGDLHELRRRLFPDDMPGIGLLSELVREVGATAISAEDLLDLIVTEVTQPDIPIDVADVRVMSLHKSKGLSSPVVFIAGCIEGALPVAPDVEATPEQAEAHLEEQRRLFYVGLTRVKAVPQNAKPGTLILSMPRQLGLADALGAGIRPAREAWGIAHVVTSRFIQELGPTAPEPIAA